MGSFLALADSSIHLAPSSNKRTKLNVSSFEPLKAYWRHKLGDEARSSANISSSMQRNIVHKQSWVHVSAQWFSPHTRARKWPQIHLGTSFHTARAPGASLTGINYLVTKAAKIWVYSTTFRIFPIAIVVPEKYQGVKTAIKKELLGISGWFNQPVNKSESRPRKPPKWTFGDLRVI